MYPVCIFVCFKCVHTFSPQHSSVWAAYFQEHTSWVVSVSMSHRSLNTDPMSCMWIGRFSAGSDSWGVNVSQAARADSCSFPSPSFPTVRPCAASSSPECQHSCNYLRLTSQDLCGFFYALQPQMCLLFPPRGLDCLFVAHLHISFVYVSHHLYFLQECYVGFTAAEWHFYCLVNILPQVIIHHLLLRLLKHPTQRKQQWWFCSFLRNNFKCLCTKFGCREPFWRVW